MTGSGTKLQRQGRDVWTCVKEEKRIYWTKDFEDGTAKQA